MREANTRKPAARFAGALSDRLFVAADGFFVSRRVQFAGLVTRYATPATYPAPEVVEGGGSMSYGPNIAHGYRQAGVFELSQPPRCGPGGEQPSWPSPSGRTSGFL